MPTGATDIAIKHIKQLGTELNKDLESIEQKLTDLEADGVLKRGRVEELAEALHALNQEWGDSATISQTAPGAKAIPEEIHLAQETLTDFLDEKRLDVGLNEKLTDAYSRFRARVIETINALEIITSVIRKPDGTPRRQPTPSSTAGLVQIPGSESGLPPAQRSSAIIRSQELERQRIAREIHDGPAQAMANVVLRMDILLKIFNRDPSKVPGELDRMKEIAQGALDEIRGFIFDLRPMTLQDLGLVATIKRVVGSHRELTDIDVRFVVEGEERSLGPLVALTAFRIAQEALNNLRKHAKCRTAWVHLKYIENKVILIVEDDGVGFDVDEVARSQKKYNSFGFLGMQERADGIGAELEVCSEPGAGTKVVLAIPTVDNPALDAEWDSGTKNKR